MRNLFTNLFIMAALLLPSTASAYDFIVDGLAYNILTDSTVYVTYQNNEAPTYTNLPEEINIPTSVSCNGNNYTITTIGYAAFQGCTNVRMVSMPNSITSIGQSAFRDCANLSCIIIPKSVDTIRDYAFWGCNSIESIKIETGNSTFDSRENCNAIIHTNSNMLILGCKNTTIPNSVSSIGPNAFLDCTGLLSITIPNSVTDINSDAFYGCTGLVDLVVGESVSWIAPTSFRNCNNIKSLTWNAKNCNTTGSMPKGNMETITIGENVNSLPSQFASYSKITEIRIPSSVISIGYAAFLGCEQLTDVYISNLEVWCNIDFPDSSNPLFYAKHLYLNDQEIKNLVIPEGITVINNGFAGFKGIYSVEIPNSVESICQNSFIHCSNLTSIVFGENVNEIKSGAFYGADNIKTIKCNRYRPASMSDDNIFSESVYSNATLQVPYGSISLYYSAPVWMKFDNIIEEGSETTPLKGDMNDDGIIDVEDVNALINIILKL